ncbi:mitochondrial S-adenosylmethionine carrier protein-like [Clytia hemisphaerica]|uniref:mitochondrial S-adenosylmethionine carrier protein-like n=1 Tax=Clytia hemisphaerica TaxID=252671 RepID=UPI0034D3DB9E
MTSKEVHTSILTSLLAGSCGGISTDIVLFPLDSIKTRAQTQAGFWKSGGFKGLFRGVGSVALGSAPSGASFFFAYEGVKNLTKSNMSPLASHLLAASCGEVFSCMFRIPFEVVKQTAQANKSLNSLDALKFIVKRDGLAGLTRGFFSMVSREIPFTVIQFPLWEHLKTLAAKDGKPCTPLASAVAGSFAGGFAAALTTPMDVAKTRIILVQNEGSHGGNPYKVMYIIGKTEGIARLFSGIVPRVVWISIGGFIFLGTYEKSKQILQDLGI